MSEAELALYQHAEEAIACAREAIAIAERVIERNRELEQEPPEGCETLTLRIHEARETLMPGFDFDFEELFGQVRDALRAAIDAKRAELAAQ